MLLTVGILCSVELSMKKRFRTFGPGYTHSFSVVVVVVGGGGGSGGGGGGGGLISNTFHFLFSHTMLIIRVTIIRML